MASIIGLDIPPGLETLFQNFLGFFTTPATDVLRVSNISVPRARKVELKKNTYLFFLSSIYDSLSSGLKASWVTYWGLLPFGGHHGAGGYPGSGFSGFVFLNSFFHKAGFSPFSDPFDFGLMTNGDLLVDFTDWTRSGVGDWLLVPHGVQSYVPTCFLVQDIVLTAGNTYRLSFYYQSITAGRPVDFKAGLGLFTSDNTQHITGVAENLTFYSHDFLCAVGDFDGPTVSIGISQADYNSFFTRFKLELVP